MTFDSETLKVIYQILPKNPAVYILLVFAGLVGWVMFMPEKVEKAREIFFWLLGGLSSNFRKRFHRSAIKNSLNPQIRVLESQLGLEGKLPKVDVRFRSAVDNRKSVLVGGSVVLFLRDTRSFRGENVAKAALMYANVALYRKSRPYMSDTTGRALDLVLTKRLVREDKDAFYFFTENYLADACKNDEQLNSIYLQLVACDEAGLLPGILLHQLLLLTSRLYPLHTYSLDVQSEFTGFIRWLAGVAGRGRGENVTPFDIRYIRVGIILVGRDETLSERGLEPYQKYFARLIQQDFQGTYILASGRKVGLVKQLIESLENNAYFTNRISRAGIREVIRNLSVDKYLKIEIGYVPIRPRSENIPREESSSKNNG